MLLVSLICKSNGHVVINQLFLFSRFSTPRTHPLDVCDLLITSTRGGGAWCEKKKGASPQSSYTESLWLYVVIVRLGINKIRDIKHD